MKLPATVPDSSATSEEKVESLKRESSSSTPKEPERRPGLLAAAILFSALASSSPNLTAIPVGYVGRRREESAVTEAEYEEADRHLELRQEVRDIFKRGASEHFEDGVHTRFSRDLLRFLSKNQRNAFEAIADYVFGDMPSATVVSEALRWIADVNDPDVRSHQWALLVRSLDSPSPKVRDGAVLGFASLGDPHVQSLLSDARSKEGIEELRKLMDEVVKQLGAKSDASPTA